MSHARLAPSSAKLWSVCPASVRRQEGLPDECSEPATWGTVAHAILERALLSEVHPADAHVDDIQVDARDDYQGVGFTVGERYGVWDLEEMRKTAAVAYEHVQFQGKVYAESKTDIGAAAGRDDCWGTADITVVFDRGLEVVDLKGGKGVIVEPDDPQLWLYAVGQLHAHFGPLVPLDLTVTGTIVQPRASHPDGPIRSLTRTSEEVLDWFHNTMKPAMAATDAEDAPAVPGDHCQKGFCKARGSCPERTQGVLNAFKPLGAGPLADVLTRPADQLTPDQVRYVLDNASLIKGWLSSVEAHAANLAKSGAGVPGYKLVAGKSNRRWAIEGADLLKALSNLSRQDGQPLSPDEYLDSSPVSPAQAEKRIKPVVTEETWGAVQKLIVKPEGAPTLVPETDRRAPIRRPAAEVFKPVSGAETLDFLQ